MSECNMESKFCKTAILFPGNKQQTHTHTKHKTQKQQFEKEGNTNVYMQKQILYEK